MASCAWLSGGSRLQAQGFDGVTIDREAFLRAISEVETGGNSRAVGQAGERGMFQFRRQTWQQYTKRSFFEAHNPSVARSVAGMHFDWLFDGFRRNGRTPTPYLMAAAWNAGLSRTLSGRLPKTTRDYAARVTNVFASTVPAQIPAIRLRVFIASSAE